MREGELDVVDVDEAARILEVTADRVMVLLEEGLLEDVGGGTQPRFERQEVVALRELGG